MQLLLGCDAVDTVLFTEVPSEQKIPSACPLLRRVLCRNCSTSSTHLSHEDTIGGPSPLLAAVRGERLDLLPIRKRQDGDGRLGSVSEVVLSGKIGVLSHLVDNSEICLGVLSLQELFGRLWEPSRVIPT